MKTLFNGLKLTLLSLCLLFLLPARQAKAQGYYNDSYQNDGSYQEFYDALSPYGQWIDDPQYGYAWVPDVSADFRPYYTNGYWVMTDYGNTWVSDYSWGWAPFHYGRWTYDSWYGWIWIPDNVWGPAWVSWRSGGGYYGWAPLGPGFNVSVSFGNYYAPDDWWVFTPCEYIYNPRFRRHVRSPRYNNTIINNTTVINNTYVNNHRTYVAGPRREQVEQQTHQQVPVYRISDSRKPAAAQVRNDQVSIYRPAITAAPSRNVRPQRVMETSRPISAPQPMSSRPQEGPRQATSSNPDRPRFEANPVDSRPRTDRNVSNQQPVREDRPVFGGRVEPAAPRQDSRPNRFDNQRPEPAMPQRPVEQPRPVFQQSRPVYEQPRPAMQQPRQMPQRPVMEQAPVQRVERPAMEQPRMERPAPQASPSGFERSGGRPTGKR